MKAKYIWDKGLSIDLTVGKIYEVKKDPKNSNYYWFIDDVGDKRIKTSDRFVIVKQKPISITVGDLV